MTELTREHIEQLDRLTETVRELDGAVEALILNETAVLEGLAQMLSAVHQMQTKAEETQRSLSEQVRGFGVLLASQTEKRIAKKAIVVSATEFDSENPEIGLLQHLYSFLPNTTAIDIGAHVGETAECLLDSGYTVIAFEPFPASFAEIESKRSAHSKMQAFPWAIGPKDGKMDLYIASDLSGKDKSDPSLFHTLSPHSVRQDLQFTKCIPVQVRSLDSLVQSHEIPQAVGLLKIDTEGYDLEVMRGMGSLHASVVMAEFWDAQHEFGKSGRGRIGDLITEMKHRGYAWHLVIYHVNSKLIISYYHNRRDTIPDSWGNVIFFEDQQLFAESLRWAESVLPPTLYR